MGKFFVRITVIFVAIYFILAHLIAHFLGIDILNGNHVLLFELIAVLYSFEHGKYHCKFLRWTMLSIFIAELLSRLDYSLNFLDVSEHNDIIIVVLAIGLSISVVKAIQHFIKVAKYKKQRNKHYGDISGNNSTKL